MNKLFFTILFLITCNFNLYGKSIDFIGLKNLSLSDLKTISKIDLDKERFKVYTRNQTENEELHIARDLMQTLKKLDKYRTRRPAFIQNAFQNFIRYDFRSNEYVYNVQYR